MFPELRAVQIEVPGDVLEMREGSDEAPAHEAGALALQQASERMFPRQALSQRQTRMRLEI